MYFVDEYLRYLSILCFIDKNGYEILQVFTINMFFLLPSIFVIVSRGYENFIQINV